MLSKKLIGILFTWTLFSVVKSLCPNLEDIAPCNCHTIRQRTTLKCANITNVRELLIVAEKSDGYRYDEVFINGAVLPYIPFKVMEKIRTTSLSLKDMRLTQLFQDIPHTGDELKNLYLQNIRLEKRRFSWDVFKYTKGIEFLYLDHVSIPVITKEFSEFVTHELKGVYFLYTNTKEIKIGAFKDFRRLDTITIAFNNLQKIQRNSLPNPFYGRTLYFQNNNLTEVHESFLSQMPYLNAVYFSRNQISRLYEPFDMDNLSRIETIDFTGNPIKCDCHLKWIANLDRKNIRGMCIAPKHLKGKRLEKLTEDDFDC